MSVFLFLTFKLIKLALSYLNILIKNESMFAGILFIELFILSKKNPSFSVCLCCGLGKILSILGLQILCLP